MTGKTQDYRVDARGEVMALLRQMRQAAKDPARVRQITDQLEVLTMAHLEPSMPDPIPDVPLSRMHRRFFARLLKNLGHWVTRDQLMNALYFDSLRDEPEGNVLSVMYTKMRPKLTGSGFDIEGRQGCGYRLVATC